MAKNTRRTIKDFFLPHKGNGYKPLMFSAGAIAVLVLAVLLVQAAYVVDLTVVFKKTGFLASVLPGVLVSLANEDRVANGVDTLTHDPLLDTAAQMKADDMAEKGYFAHVAPDGTTPWHWLDAAGYGYTYAGENLAVDFTDSKDVEEAWVASPTHRANIVKPHYTHIGIGVAHGVYNGEETTFVVQFFALPSKEQVAKQTTNIATTTGRVLGASVEPAGVASFFAQVAASPNHTVTYVLSGLAVLFGLLLALAIFVHMRVQYLEAIGGGLLILLVTVSMLVFNATTTTEARVPGGGAAATVSGV